MKRLLTLLVWVCCTVTGAAQDSIGVPADAWQEMLDAYYSDGEEEETVNREQLYELLGDLASQHPNLNNATREELEQLPFLSEAQVADILEYIYKYKVMRSWGELILIPSLEEPQRKLLPCFFVLEPKEQPLFPSLKNILRYGKHDLTVTGRIPFYRREGDRKGYQGYPYRHSFRYTFQYGQRVKLGLIGAQDAGEQFFSGRNQKGYDYYSFYLYVSKLGRLKSAVVGRYRMHLGMGLVMNNDFSLGKLAMLQSVGRSTNSIRPHSSRMESTYLQGGAATLTLLRGLDVTAFVSSRKIDATLDSAGQTITTLLTSGYHRTESEIRRKHNATETLGGANVHFRSNGFHVGVTAVATHYSLPLQPNTKQLFRRYYPSGSNFWNVSTDYGYNSRRLNISGETAIDQGHALATINSIGYELTSSLTLMALQRFYSYRYNALRGNSFSDGSTVRNESGLYIGAQWQPTRQFQLMAYTDYAYSPWAKYQISQASHSWDHLVGITWKSSAWQILARYRLRLRQRDNAEKTALEPRTEHRARLSLGYESQRMTLRTQADWAQTTQRLRSRGYMLSQHAGLTMGRVSLNGMFGYFHTDDYDSRIYLYERNMQHEFYFPMYYGEGIRYSLWARLELSKRMWITMKIGTTNYFDRDHIGSSYQQINQSSQTDADLQLRFRF